MLGVTTSSRNRLSVEENAYYALNQEIPWVWIAKQVKETYRGSAALLFRFPIMRTLWGVAGK